MDEELLEGGNTHEAIVRVGDTVRRPTGPWTPGVHALLRHLEAEGFEGSPRVLGMDDLGREVLTFVGGDVVYPDHLDLLGPDEALAEIARLIRSFHDAVAGFDPRAYEWSERGADGTSGGELVCHNDLAPWNLIRRPGGGWAFVDWDLAAPGHRSWDLAWSLLTLAPLMPDFGIPGAEPAHRLRVFRDAYGAEHVTPSVVDVARARCDREAALIRSLGAAGDPGVRASARRGSCRDLGGGGGSRRPPYARMEGGAQPFASATRFGMISGPMRWPMLPSRDADSP